MAITQTFTDGSWMGSTWMGNAFMGGSHAEHAELTWLALGAGYKIIFYDLDDVKLGEISSETQNTPLIRSDFANEDIGCASFSIEMFELPDNLSTVTYNYRVDFHLFGSYWPWYSGYITEVPKAGTTKPTYTIKGYGHYNKLATATVSGQYINRTISYVVDDLMRTQIEAKTKIIYKPTKIEPSSYILQGTIRWDRVYAKDVLKQLAELAGFQVGVDARRELFFRSPSTDIADNVRFWVGTNIDDFDPVEDAKKIKNTIHVYGGEVTGSTGGKTNYVTTVEDAASIAAYGVREAKMTLPSSFGADDAQRWGELQLETTKDPVQKGKITGVVATSDIIENNGYAQVTTRYGLHEYSYPIKKVKYDISSNGINVSLDLGEKDLSFTEEQVKLKQELETLESLGDERTRQA